MLQKTPCLERRDKTMGNATMSLRKSKKKYSVPSTPGRCGEGALDFLTMPSKSENLSKKKVQITKLDVAKVLQYKKE